MEQNVQESPIIRFFKKIWPSVNRITNSIIYFLLSTLKSIMKVAIEQIKGAMRG